MNQSGRLISQAQAMRLPAVVICSLAGSSKTFANDRVLVNVKVERYKVDRAWQRVV